MKTLNAIGALMLLLGFCSLTSCNNPDTDLSPDPNADAPMFLFDDNGVCYTPSTLPISAATFYETVLHAGWKHVCTYKIDKDGNYADEEYYSHAEGRGPHHFYFENESTVKQYVTISAIPLLAGFYICPYQLDEENNHLTGESGTKNIDLQILSLSQDEIKGIEYLGVRSNGEKVYGYATYKRMTSEELAEIEQQYPTDLEQREGYNTPIQ